MALGLLKATAGTGSGVFAVNFFSSLEFSADH
jgi:hypothetical protein